METINDVTAGLSFVFDGLKNGTIAPGVATEMNNAAGKIVKGKLGQLTYYQDRKEKPEIKFWDETAK
jgi:hypothetical protein